MVKNRRNAGFTLIEMMVCVLILVLLVMGMGVGMDAGSRIYRDATFESDSATLAGILNSNLGDILRYSIRIRYKGDEDTPAKDKLTEAEILELEQDIHPADPGNPEVDGSVEFVFTSLDYGIQDAYFYTPPNEAGGYAGVLQLKNLRNENVVELVNSGAYPDLMVSNFSITFFPRRNPGIEGGYFDISYDIYHLNDLSKVRHVNTIVRLMND